MAIIIGFDLGHGETSVGNINSENVKGNVVVPTDLYIVGDNEKIPSIVCKLNDGWKINPQPAEMRYITDYGVCFKGPMIGSKDFPKITEVNKNYFSNFIKLVYNHTMNNVKNGLVGNSENHSVYIACPSGWNEEQATAYEDFIRDELKIPIQGVIQESRAAYIGGRRMLLGNRWEGNPQKILVIDYGSSTIDFTFFNMEETDLDEMLQNWGCPLGASKVEETLLDYTIKDYPNNQEMVKRIYQTVGEKMGRNILLLATRQIKEDFFENDKSNLVINIDLRTILGREYQNLYIETKSEEGYSKQDIKNILSDYIAQLQKMLNEIKNQIGNADVIILTGGASRMHFFIDMVKATFPNSNYQVDRFPSLTISRGIAAIGAVDTAAQPLEEDLREAIEDWKENELESLLLKIINEEVSSQYYSEITRFTERYKNGYISKNGCKSLTALFDELDSLLGTWVSDADVLNKKINENINTHLKEALHNEFEFFLSLYYGNDFSFDVGISDVDIYLSCVLTSDSVESFAERFVATIYNAINNRDFFGTTESTPTKDRDFDDRKFLVDKMNAFLSDWRIGLHYDDDLDTEIEECAQVVDDATEDLIKKAKLQMYKTA